MTYRIIAALLLLGSLCSPILAQNTPLSSTAPNTQSTLEDLLSGSQQDSAEALLTPEEAFIVTVDINEDQDLIARWEIADGYYLYRKRFRFAVKEPGVDLGDPQYPPGGWQEDEFFGNVETYRDRVEITIPVRWQDGSGRPQTLELETLSQGCADVGVCYPPRKESIPVILPGPR